MDTKIINILHKNFEERVQLDEGIEYWFARDLQILLGYDRWENFEKVISKAINACRNAKQQPDANFRNIVRTVDLHNNAKKEIKDIMLTRYACYLIAQNGDPRKDEIAFAQTYFAVQTRKQEVIVQRLAEWERLKARQKLSVSEKNLSGILFERNVDHQGFARIRSKGDAALFGGLNTQDMKDKLGVPDKRPLADFLPAVTITAKELANQITNLNVKKSAILIGEKPISDEHVKNNKNMREMLGKSGVKPEELPAEEDIKRISTKIKKIGKGKLLLV